MQPPASAGGLFYALTPLTKTSDFGTKNQRKIGEGKQKKVLSLVLCVAMMLSVMVVGAGAAFSDQSKIKNTEAVDACTALNIIGGYPGGSFKPEGNITRAEVTKMICVALNGGKNPAVSTNTTPTFSDVRGNANAAWAEGYIESCAAQGIVSGVGGGKFAPNGNVTGVQLAKMLLVSLGYKSENEGFTGNAWATNVNVRAAQKGLYAGLEKMDTSAAITRDNAAQMVWNAMNAYEVEYKTTLVTDSKGQLTSQITVQDKVDGNFKKITLLKDKYEADKEDAGVLLSCTKVSGKDYYTIVTTDKGEYKKISADVSDMIGMKVQVLHKDTDTEDVVYGVYADEDSKVIASGTVGQLEDVTSDSNKTKLNGTEYKLDSSITVIEPNQYKLATTSTSATSTSTETLANLESKTTLGYVAGTVKLIDTNGNNKVDTVVYTPAKVGQITYAGSKSVTINNGVGANDIDDLDIYKDYAKDDWTTVVDDAYTASTNTAVTKVDVVSSKVSSIKAKTSSKPQEVKINDTWYKVVTDGKNEDTDKIVSGSTYDFAIVGNYIVNAKETEASSSDILVVTDYETATNGMQGSTTQKVKAYFLDGTSKVITVEKLALTAGADATDVKASTNVIAEQQVNKLYTYSTRSNGNYTLKALGDGNKAGYENIDTTNKVTGKNKMGTYSINDDAVIFVLYNDSGRAKVKDNVKILSGKTVNDWSKDYNAEVQYATKKTNGVETVRVAVVAADSKYDGASSDYKYAYMTSASYEGTNGEDNDKTTVYEAWNGSENITLKYDGSNGTSKAAGDVLVYSNDGADFINIESDVNIYKVAITGIEKKKEGTVAVQGVKVGETNVVRPEASYKMDEDCVYIAVNDDKQEGMAGSSLDQISLAEETTTSGVYYLNAYIVVEKNDNGTDGDILAIIYDADNNRLNGEKVSAGNLKATDKVTVPAGSTLDLTGVTVAKGATVTLDKEAAVVLPNGKKVDAKALKATGDLVLTANNNGGVTVTAANGTQITVATAITLGDKDGKNFYDTNGTTSLNKNVSTGTYKFATEGSKWVKQA